MLKWDTLENIGSNQSAFGTKSVEILSKFFANKLKKGTELFTHSHSIDYCIPNLTQNQKHPSELYEVNLRFTQYFFPAPEVCILQITVISLRNPKNHLYLFIHFYKLENLFLVFLGGRSLNALMALKIFLSLETQEKSRILLYFCRKSY